MPLNIRGSVRLRHEFIEYVTATDYMPPWTPTKASHFVGERVLTLAEKQFKRLGPGKPEGDPDNPGIPSFPEGSQIGTPDMVLYA